MEGYEIRVRHRLGPPVTFLLRDLDPQAGADVTVLRVDGSDQALLHAALSRVGDLGLQILSVETVDDRA